MSKNKDLLYDLISDLSDRSELDRELLDCLNDLLPDEYNNKAKGGLLHQYKNIENAIENCEENKYQLKKSLEELLDKLEFSLLSEAKSFSINENEPIFGENDTYIVEQINSFPLELPLEQNLLSEAKDFCDELKNPNKSTKNTIENEKKRLALLAWANQNTPEKEKLDELIDDPEITLLQKVLEINSSMTWFPFNYLLKYHSDLIDSIEWKVISQIRFRQLIPGTMLLDHGSLYELIDEKTHRQEFENFWDENPHEYKKLLSKIIETSPEEKTIEKNVDLEIEASNQASELIKPVASVLVEESLNSGSLSDLDIESLGVEAVAALNPVPKEIELEDPEPIIPIINTPREVGLWEKNLWPFITQNIVMVLASASVFTGLLILLISFWNEAAWIRYMLAPITLLGSSWGLSKAAKWLQSQDIKSRIPVAILECFSIFIAPQSLLMVAFLFSDPNLNFWLKIFWGFGLAIGLLYCWKKLFYESSNRIVPQIATQHSRVLLLINSILLLLPIAIALPFQANGDISLLSKSILVSGFYIGFLALTFNLKTTFYKHFDSVSLSEKIGPLFYCISCCGSFLLVWVLTHARLGHLPNLSTYSPMIVFTAALVFLIENRLKAQSILKNEVQILSYFAFFMIALGLSISINDAPFRTINLFLAGFICLNNSRHQKNISMQNVSLGILTLALMSFALFPEFTSFLFPWLVLVIHLIWRFVYLKVENSDLKTVAFRASWSVLLLALIPTISWQWFSTGSAYPWGIALLLQALFLFNLAYRVKNIYLIHLALTFAAVSLPYCGFAPIAEHHFNGHCLILGLALLSALWIYYCSLKKSELLYQCRSSVLWSISVFALALMILRVIRPEHSVETSTLTQTMILSGPILMSLILLLTAYFSQSSLPVYNSLIVLVLVFPEIKDQFGIQMKSGLGSSASALGFLICAFMLKKQKWLNRKRVGDLIFGQKPFPLVVQGHHLFTKPLLVAIAFLILRLCFWIYPRNAIFGFSDLEIKTTLALIVSSITLLGLSQWSRKQIYSAFAIALFIIGSMHSAVIYGFSAKYLPNIFCINLIGLHFLFTALSKSHKCDASLSNPWFSIRSYIPAVLVICIPLYAGAFSLGFNDVIGVLLIGAFISFYTIFTEKSVASLYVLFFLIWEGILIFIIDHAYNRDLNIIFQDCFNSSVIYFLCYALLIQLREFKKKTDKIEFLSYLSPLCLVLTTVVQIFLVYNSYSQSDFQRWPLIVNSISLLIIARIVIAPPITLMAYVGLTIACFPYSWSDYIKNSLGFIGLSCVLAVLTKLYRIFPKLEFSRLKSKTIFFDTGYTHILLAVSASLSALYGVLLSIEHVRPIQTNENAVFCWGICLTAFLTSSSLKVSKHLYLLISFTTCVWLNLHLNTVDLQNLLGIKTTHISSLALLSCVYIFVIIEVKVKSKDFWYQNLKTVFSLGALSLLVLTYFSNPSIDSLSNARFIFSGLLSIGLAFYFRYLVENERKTQLYGFYAASVSMAIMCTVFWGMQFFMKDHLSPEKCFWVMAIAPLWFSMRMEYNFNNARTFEPSRNAAFALLFLLAGFYIYQPLFQWVMFPNVHFELSRYSSLAPIACLSGVALARIPALKGDVIGLYFGSVFSVLTFFASLTVIPFFSVYTNPHHAFFLATLISLLIVYSIQKNRVLYQLLKIWSKHDQQQHKILKHLLDFTLLILCHFLLLASLYRGVGGGDIVFHFIGMVFLWALIGHSNKKIFYFYFSFIFLLMASLSLNIGIMPLFIFHVLLFVLDELYFSRIFKNSEKHFHVWLLLSCICIVSFCFLNQSSMLLKASTLAFVWFSLLITPLSAEIKNSSIGRCVGAVVLYLPTLILFILCDPSKPYSLLIFMLSISVLNLWVQYFAPTHLKYFTFNSKHRNRILHAAIDFSQKEHSYIFLVIQIFISACCLALNIQNNWIDSLQFFNIIFILHAVTLYYWIKNYFEKQESYKILILEALFISLFINCKFALIEHFQIPWTEVYDLYMATSFSLLTVVLRPVLKRFGSSQAPIKYSLYALPLLSLIYGITYDVDMNHLAHVMLIHAVVLSWKGVTEKDRLSLSYSFLGYNAYLFIMLINSNIDSLQAYLIPSSITTLVLLQIFRDQTSQSTANVVRFFSLSILLGYSLFDTLFTQINNPISHIIIIGLCCAVLVTSYFLRIKIFAMCATFCFCIDLVSIVFITIKSREQDIMRILLGSCLTLGGGGVLILYLIYRKYKTQIELYKDKFTSHWLKWD